MVNIEIGIRCFLEWNTQTFQVSPLFIEWVLLVFFCSQPNYLKCTACSLLSIYRIVLFSIEFKMKSLEELSSNMWVHLNLFRSLWMWIKIGESDKVNRHSSKIRFGRIPATDVHTLCKMKKVFSVAFLRIHMSVSTGFAM